MRYFYSQIAQRALQQGGLSIEFDKTAIIGSNICGVYKTNNPAEVSVLESAVHQRLGVEEITETDYETQLAQKKTTRASAPSLTSNYERNRVLQDSKSVTVEPRQGVTLAENEQAPKSSDQPSRISDILDIPRIESVNSPDPIVAESERSNNGASLRQRRNSIRAVKTL
jgi:hypothetical protein